MPVEFNDMALSSAQAGFRRLKTAVNEVLDFVGGSDNLVSDIDIDEVQQFKEAMDNDFNTSKGPTALRNLRCTK
jgi:cysteinyl-tRNA synthetase